MLMLLSLLLGKHACVLLLYSNMLRLELIIPHFQFDQFVAWLLLIIYDLMGGEVMGPSII